MKRNSILRGALAASAAFILIGCTSPTPKHEGDKQALASESSAAIDAFTAVDPALKSLIDKASGYAVFPDVGKGGFIAGGSYGKGEVFEGGKKIGYADVTQATIGLQAGAQTFDEIILFMRPEELSNFKEGEYKLAANASVVALKAGAADTVDPGKGVIAVVRTKGGAMGEAAIGAQRFRFHPLGQ
jgi:lipid-binding SYLF domain-containing protein